MASLELKLHQSTLLGERRRPPAPRPPTLHLQTGPTEMPAAGKVVFGSRTSFSRFYCVFPKMCFVRFSFGEVEAFPKWQGEKKDEEGRGEGRKKREGREQKGKGEGRKEKKGGKGTKREGGREEKEKQMRDRNFAP